MIVCVLERWNFAFFFLSLYSVLLYTHIMIIIIIIT
jgi:hypothetical protein